MSEDGTIIQAGKLGGRGFFFEAEEQRFVITAAHCLDRLPPAHPASCLEERTYKNFLGPMGGRRTVWAECLFVDPIADIAVFGEPDNQELSEKAEAYGELAGQATAFALGKLRPRDTRREARLFSLEGVWFPCRVVRTPGARLWIEKATQPILGGMSGSPIILPDGSAVGVVCISGGDQPEDSQTEGGPNPMLSSDLPVWLWKATRKRREAE